MTNGLAPCFLIAVIAILSPSCNSLPATSNNGDLEAVCKKVTQTTSYWGTRVAHFNPTCDESLRGLGPKVLEVASLSSNFSMFGKISCYQPITPALCNVQFDKYSSAPGCPTTTNLFFDIVKTCQKTNSLSAAMVTCPSFDRSTLLIGDPGAFCSGALLREDGPEDPKTGLPSSFSTKKFSGGQVQDCQQSAMTYNACIRIGVKQLGYKVDYCVGGGFNAYCTSTLGVVKDESFLFTNVIIPALVEYLVRHHSRLGSAFCDNIYQKWFTYLAARKGTALLKSRASLQTLQSTARIISYMNEFYKQSLIKSEGVDGSYLQAAEKLFNNFDGQDVWQNNYTMGYTPFIACQLFSQEFYELEEAVNKTKGISSALVLPLAQSDGTVGFQDMRNINGALDLLSTIETSTTVSFRTLADQIWNTTESMTVIQRIPNTEQNAEAYTAYHISKDRRDSLRNQVVDTIQQNYKFRAAYDRMIDVFPNLHTSKDQLYVNEGIRQVRLGLLRDVQLRLLMSIRQKSDPSDVIKAAGGSIGIG